MKKILSLLMILTLILAFSACANPNKGYISALQATNESVVYMAKKAKTMCEEKKLSESDCIKIKSVYGEIRLADDAVIDLTQAAIISGNDPSDTSTYPAAMGKLMNAVNNLVTLLSNLKVIGGGK